MDVCWIHTTEALRERIGQEAKRTIREKNNEKIMAKEIEEFIYQQVKR